MNINSVYLEYYKKYQAPENEDLSGAAARTGDLKEKQIKKQ